MNAPASWLPTPSAPWRWLGFGSLRGMLKGLALPLLVGGCLGVLQAWAVRGALEDAGPRAGRAGYRLAPTAEGVWRLDLATGRVSLCTAPRPEAPPVCSPWSVPEGPRP